MDELPGGIFDEDVWEEVYVEQAFAFVWPDLEEWYQPPTPEPPLFPPDPLPDPWPPDPLPDPWPPLPPPPPDPVLIIHHVIAVSADEWPDVEYDLIGVRGAYRMCPLFAPVIHFVTHDVDYLYEYLADLTQYKLVPYTCTYTNGQIVTYIIRVWNNYSIGRDWIIARITYEQARAAAQDGGSALPAPPGSLCPQ